MVNVENSKAQMRKGVLELCILSIIARGQVYPSDIIYAMRESSISVVEGTLYPLLTRLKNAELISYTWVESTSGPPRKYFTITESGKSLLEELKSSWRALNHAVENVIK
jgi:PadR family transcriptional regulator PadR